MKVLLNLLVSALALAACAAPAPALATQSALPTATLTPTLVPATPTDTATQPAPTSTPTTPATATAIPCDPLDEDYCISAGSFLFQRPIRPPGNDAVDETYPYASTARGKRDTHHGVEFLNKFGTPVVAASQGVVVYSGSDRDVLFSLWPNFYGNVIVLQHSENLYTLYAHLSKIYVQAGQAVQAGEKIGEVGQSGVAIGSHLHFEVRVGEPHDYFAAVNPELWLLPKSDESGQQLGALQISIRDSTGQFRLTDWTLAHYRDRSQPPVLVYYLSTYAREMVHGDENAAIGDLSPGTYRIAFTMNDHVYERWVEVKSGKLTQVAFRVK